MNNAYLHIRTAINNKHQYIFKKLSPWSSVYQPAETGNISAVMPEGKKSTRFFCSQSPISAASREEFYWSARIGFEITFFFLLLVKALQMEF